MKKKDVVSLLIAVALLILPVAVYSQDIRTVPFDEKYKDQSCIFLLYDVSVELKDDWSYVTKEHKKLKIQNEDGKTMGDVPILYDRSREKVSNISAHTITPDGKRHKYAKIQDVQVFEGFDMYSDERVKIINMPEANIGSIIEFEYTKTTSRDQIKGQFWHVTDLINTIPIKELNLTFVFPKKLSIKYKEFNLKQKPKIIQADKKITYSWRLKDVEIRPEEDSYTPPPNLENIEDGLEFSSIKNWKDISDWYYGLIEKNMRTTPQIREVAQGLIMGKSTVKEKVRAILEYIQDNFRYVSMSFGDNALEPHPTDEVFRNKYGDCKDLSLLCVYMLKEAGIKSNIALFNTNNFAIEALTVADLYKARWKVELFFKWIKQHLRIKAFFGTSENAVKTQIWTAISIYVIIAIIKKRLALKPDLYTILQILSVSIFEKAPIAQALMTIDAADKNDRIDNQLLLFNL